MTDLINRYTREQLMLNRQFRPLWDLVDLVGYNNITRAQQKDYQILAHKINMLDKKIAVLIKDNFNIK